jgi:Ca2+/Na+ antiporter
MIVLKVEQAARMQRSKDEERKAKESMLVSVIFSLFGSKDLYCFECHVIVLLCCYEFYMIVLKAEQATRMQRRKDEEREAKEHMLVSYYYYFFWKFISKHLG